MEALSSLRESHIRNLCKAIRYEIHDTHHVLFRFVVILVNHLYIHFVYFRIFLFILFVFRSSFYTPNDNILFLVCYVYYLLIYIYIHTHSSWWLCTPIASTHCWNTVTVNYLSIFDDRCAVIYFMSKLRCCIIYRR